MNLAVLTVLSLIVISILIKILDGIRNKKMYDALKNFPSLPTLPFFGNLHLLYGSINDLLAKAEKIMGSNDRFVFWIGPVPCLVLKKFNDIAAVLNRNHDRDTMNMLDEWIGTGILNAEYAEWKTSRKLLTPVFHSNMLTEYANIFNRNALKLIERLKPIADRGEIVDVWDYVKYTNLDSILAITLGKSMENVETDGSNNYCDTILEFSENITKRVLTIWLHPRVFYQAYLKLTRRTDKVLLLKELPTKVLSGKSMKIQNNKSLLPREDNSSSLVIDLLLKKTLRDDNLTETRIRDEIMHLIIAGSETTALNVSFTLLMLAINQDIQKKVYEEVMELMPTDDTLTVDITINDLKYLEQCLKETARAYSQAVYIFRRIRKDCFLSDNKIVPRNTCVMAFVHQAHYDPELYTNPLNWDPEHFNDQAVSNRPKGSDLIFGLGPRHCLGEKYFMINSKTQIAHIIRNYHLSTNVKKLTKSDLKADLSVRSRIGYPIKFTRRQKASS